MPTRPAPMLRASARHTRYIFAAPWCLAALLCGALLAACSGPARTGPSPAPEAEKVVVARIAGEPLTLAAFEDRYVRSIPGGRADAAADSLGAYQDFLARYVDYRLKVRAAEAAGLMTDSLRREVQRYRAETARPYLMRRTVLEPITRTLYQRQQEEVATRHLLLRLAPDAAPADTLAVYEKVQALRDSVEAGTDFAALARRHSEDPSATQQGRRGYEGYLGYVQGGQLVAPYEDAAYRTPVDSLAGPVRTRFGVHLIRVEDRRPVAAPIQLSHILIRPDGRTAADTAAARATADSLAARLAAGDDFAALAQQFSEDPGSAAQGGDLGTVERGGRLVQPFEDAAFALDSVGAVSDPVQTRFGLHLIKLTGREARPSYDEAYDDLKNLASQLPRTQQAEARLARRLRAERGARLDTSALLSGTVPPAGLARALARGTVPEGAHDRSFATLGDSAYALRDLAAYAQRGAVPDAPDAAAFLLRLGDDFLSNAALAYEAHALEQRDADFRALVQEYRDGLLLFQFMQDSVWTAAMQDTPALRARYAAQPERFQQPERLRVLTLRSPQDSVLRALSERLRGGATPAAIRQAALGQGVQVDTSFADRGSNLFEHLMDMPDGHALGPASEDDGHAFLLHLPAGVLPAGRRPFEEVRMQLGREEQEAREAAVLARLRRRYAAETHPERLAQAFASPSAAAATDPR